MTILQDIRTMTIKEASWYKASKMSEILQKELPLKFDYDGQNKRTYNIIIDGISYDEKRKLLVIKKIVATTNKKKNISLDLPFEYYNPPFQVIVGFEKEPDENGIPIPILEENPLEAIKIMVGMTVERQG